MTSSDIRKPIILHLGDPIKYNHDFFEREFAKRYHVVRNDRPDRESFKEALRSNTFGDFHALFRPHFQTGGEMGQWDSELIVLLPPTCKVFASAGAGYNWADVDALAARGIWYANGAGCPDDAVSDTALWMILSVFRNFTRSQVAARTADPQQFIQAHKTNAMISRNPKGHVLGIVGLGSISKLLVPKAKAIGMEVVYHDVLRQSEGEEQRLSVRYCSTLEELLSEADCTTLHVPLTAQTHHLVNATTLSHCKPGARLINTSRGGVVDEGAVIECLQSGHISAVGLDVHENEPQVNPLLAKMENVTLTTHVGGGARETREGFELQAMQNILDVVGEDGGRVGKPFTPVNQPVLQI